MNTQRKIDLLEKIQSRIYNVSYQKPFSPEFIEWQNQAEMILKNIFPNDPNYVEKFMNIKYGLFVYSTSTTQDEENKAFRDGLNNAKALITSYIETIKLLEDSEGEMECKTEIMQNHKISDKIFIVHGRDNETKLEVARYLEQLNLKPIILHEQVSRGKTIIEKIEEYTDINYGIVLYTPCDIGGINDDDKKLRERARQNVVFEHGLLIGKIGRKNVSALVKGNIEKPNDISGIVYIDMNSNQWKIDLGKELRDAGYHIDFNVVIQ